MLWLIAGVLIASNRNSKIVLWFCLLLFFASLGAISDVLRSYIDNPGHFIIIGFVCSTISFLFCPYAYLLFSLYQSKIDLSLTQKHLLAIPIFVLIFIVIADPKFGIWGYFDFSPYFWFLAIYAIIYIIVTDFILIKAYIKEQNPKLKHQKLLTCIVFYPVSIFCAYTNYITVALKRFYIGRGADHIMVTYLMFLVAIFMVTKGFLGVRLKIQRQIMDEEGFTHEEIIQKEYNQLLKEKEILDLLSKEEQKVFVLLSEGHTKADIAKHLYKSENTIKSQVRSINKKIGVRNVDLTGG